MMKQVMENGVVMVSPGAQARVTNYELNDLEERSLVGGSLTWKGKCLTESGLKRGMIAHHGGLST